VSCREGGVSHAVLARQVGALGGICRERIAFRSGKSWSTRTIAPGYLVDPTSGGSPPGRPESRRETATVGSGCSLATSALGAP